MFIREFIEQQYPIKDILKVRLSNPIKAVMERDNLPYDKIGLDENGNLTKMVEVDDDHYMPVVELISYTPEEIKSTSNENLRVVYNSYMAMIDLQDVEIADIMASARKHEEIKHRREQQLAKCTS